MFFIKSYCVLLVCIWLTLPGTFAQEQKVADSLASIYQQNKLTGTAKFELLTDLSFHETRDLKKSLSYAEELISLSKQTGNNKYLRVGYFLKGTKKRMLGYLDEALDAYFKSADIARKLNHIKGEGESYGAIADIYAVANNHPDAMHYYRKGIATLRQAKGDPVSLASVISNAGDEFLKTKHYDSALLYFNDAKLIFDKANHISGKAYSLGNIGMVYANIGKDDYAEKNINEAIRILEEMQDYYPICVYLIAMADVYIKRGDNQTALSYAHKSMHLADQLELKEQISNAHLKLSEIYEKTGNIPDAFNHYKEHIEFRDSVKHVETMLIHMRTDYEVSQMQREMNMLHKEKQTQQAIVIFLFIILGLTIMLLGTLFWFYKSKSKEKMRLHQQELLHARLEIQEQTYQNISQELHDNIGQVLSVVKMNINTVNINNAEVANQKLAESIVLLSKVIQDIRDLSKTLNTDFLNEIGLPNAIDQQLQLLKRTGLYSTQLSVTGDADKYEPERELLVFRVVQELLNNIVKHASANQVDVSMNYETEKLAIEVRDNGQGFDKQAQQLYPNKGLGLRNIHNRLRLIKGAIYFESEPGKGTAATLEILK